MKELIPLILIDSCIYTMNLYYLAINVKLKNDNGSGDHRKLNYNITVLIF